MAHCPARLFTSSNKVAGTRKMGSLTPEQDPAAAAGSSPATALHPALPGGDGQIAQDVGLKLDFIKPVFQHVADADHSNKPAVFLDGKMPDAARRHHLGDLGNQNLAASK